MEKTDVKSKQESTVKDELDSTMEDLRNSNLMDNDLSAAAVKELEKEGNEKKIKELKSCIVKSRYINFRSVIELRRQRANARTCKKFTEKSKEILDRLMKGGKDGLTLSEYRKEEDKLFTNRKDELRENENKYSSELQELNNKYENYTYWMWFNRF